jgi:hypothetical protein
MSQLQSFISVLNRRNFFRSLAGAAATFVVGIRPSRGHELLSQTPGMDKAEMEFEIVNGWVLRRQDIAAGK